MTKAANAGISLADLNLSNKCDAPFEFEYLDPQGKPTGVFLSVLGSQSPVVQKFIRGRLNEQRARAAMMAKRGKELETTVEDDEEFANESAAVRLVGWRGITEPYSPGLALELVSINAELRGQVFKASNDLGNYNKS